MEEQITQAGGQIYLYIGMGITVAFVALDKAMNIISKKKNNGKGNSNNKNHYHMIVENRTRSLLNKQAIDAVCKSLDDMRKDNSREHERIFDKLDEMSKRI